MMGHGVDRDMDVERLSAQPRAGADMVVEEAESPSAQKRVRRSRKNGGAQDESEADSTPLTPANGTMDRAGIGRPAPCWLVWSARLELPRCELMRRWQALRNVLGRALQLCAAVKPDRACASCLLHTEDVQCALVYDVRRHTLAARRER